MRTRWAALLALLALTCTPRAAEVPLRFSVQQGAVRNEFFRQGPVAAHLVLSAGRAPRVVVAFPAGNSGAALWLESSSALTWEPRVTLRAERHDDEHGSFHGISAELSTRGAPLRVRQALLGSVRVLRAYQDTGSVPSELVVAPRVSAREIVWARKRLDGAPGYRLSIQLLHGSVKRPASDARSLELVPAPDGRLRLRLTALSAEPALTPLPEARLLTAHAAPDPHSRHVLAFLSYEEKLLAGSWRFDTYFGRDTLMTLLRLAPVAQPPLLEAGLGAVLERLNDAGEVAHEEGIGEFAVLQRKRLGLPVSDEPLFDHKMVDDDFMLAPAAARCLLDAGSPGPAKAFLARRTRAGLRYGELLVRNLRFVVESAAPFAREPGVARLISLKPGERTGNWRDSEDGLGGGRYPFDVNAAWVPAALEATARLAQSPLLSPYLDAGLRRALLDARAMAEVWRRAAPALFEVVIPAPTALQAVVEYARTAGVDAAPALRALDEQPLRFRALALDAEGQPVPVLHSDEALTLLLHDPDAGEVRRIAQTLTRPFPAGLLTDAGLLVANPAYAPPALAPQFDRARYHGTVVWGFQQALLVAALERQLARADLGADTRATLAEARDRVRATRTASQALRGAELWSWSFADGRYRIEPFGQRAAHETESNAAQLWSTISLAP